MYIYIYIIIYLYIYIYIFFYLEENQTRITWGPPDPRELETLGCCWGGAPFFIGGGTCACGLAKCCWWQVLARGGSLALY